MATVTRGTLGTGDGTGSSTTVATGAVVAGLLSLAFWSKQVDYGLLFSRIDDAEAAKVMGLSEPTAKRYWDTARAWLLREIRGIAAGG